MWKVLGVGLILSLLVGCGGSGGGKDSGNQGTGQISRAWDGTWVFTFKNQDNYDQGTGSFTITNGHLSGTINCKDPNGGPRIDKPIEGTTYTNGIIVGNVAGSPYSSPITSPNMRFTAQVPYATFASKPTNIIATH